MKGLLCVIMLTPVTYSNDFNLTSPSNIGHVRRVTKLDISTFQRQDLQTKEVWYNVTDFRGVRRYIKLDTSYTPKERRGDGKNNGNIYNRTGFSGFRRDVKLKRIFKQRHRRFNNWTGPGNIRGRRGRKGTSNRRTVRETKNTDNKSTTQDGFRHYYVPPSSIANFFLLHMIQPNHTLFLQQLKNVTVCLAHTKLRMNSTALSHCFESLTFENLFRMWMRHLVGFMILSILTWLVAVASAVILPLLVCFRMSFQPVAAASKLDSQTNATWTVLTVLGGLAMLFSLFGVITVGCAGLGIGYYLKSGRTTQVYATYEQVQAIALDGINTKRAHRLESNHTNVCTIQYDTVYLLALESRRDGHSNLAGSTEMKKK